MSSIDLLPPDGLAKRLFVFTMLGVAVYIAAVLFMLSSPDDPQAQQGGSDEGAVAQQDR